MTGEPIYQDGRRVCTRCRNVIYAGRADKPDLCMDCVAADDALQAEETSRKSDAPNK